MQIAICDDEHHQIHIYESYIEKLRELNFSIDYEVFSSGTQLLKQYEYSKRPYDLLFLDIQLEGIGGIEIAKKLREIDDKLLIVFVTSYEEYVYDSFTVNTFRYLVKPLEYEKFWEVFQAAYQEIKKKSKPFYINTSGAMIRLYCEEIIYIESDRRKARVYTRDSAYEFYAKLAEIYESLKDDDFIYVHKSYLVNMNYIRGFYQYRIELHDGRMIPVSEKRKKEARIAYSKFLTRRYHIHKDNSYG